MRRHDLAWRAGGWGLMALGYAFPIASGFLPDWGAKEAIILLIGMPLALAGTLLMVQGDRVPRSLRVERSRHRALVLAIRARRQAAGDRGASGA
jgi:hypothetical protein